MKSKKKLFAALNVLRKDELYDLARTLELAGVLSRKSKLELVDALADRSPGEVFGTLTCEPLRDMLRALELGSSGPKSELVVRLERWCGHDVRAVPDVEVEPGAVAAKLAEALFAAFTKPLLYEVASERLGDASVRSSWSSRRIADAISMQNPAEVCRRLRVDELRWILEFQDLDTEGLKQDLVSRVLSWANADSSAPTQVSLTNEEEDSAAAASQVATALGASPTLPMAELRPVAAASDRVKALLIGNQAYDHENRLTNPGKDVRDLATLLQQLGHEVTAHTDLNAKELKQSIRAFTKGLGRDDGVLFYFSGHGLQHDGDNWLLPVDFAAANPEELPDEAISLQRLLRLLDKSRFRICVLDACRVNSYRTASRGPSIDGLMASEPPDAEGTEGTLICYATAPGKVAYDGDAGANGYYTSALLSILPTPGRKIEELLKQVRRTVSEVSKGKQVPWENSSLMGDWYPAGR